MTQMRKRGWSAALGSLTLSIGLAAGSSAAMAKPYFSPLVPLPPFVTEADLVPPPPAAASPAAAPPAKPAAAPPSAQATVPKCEDASSVATPATAPQRAAKDGTAPGNDGSTGWSGGTGGSQIGLNTQGANPESKTWQPPTARGLDLRGVPDAVVQPAKC